MRVIAIIGGSQEVSLKKIAKRYGVEVLFHDGKNSRKGQYRSIVEKADSICMMTGACSHKAMWLVKSLAKELDKPISFQRGFGLSGAIYLALKKIKTKKDSKRKLGNK